MKEYCVEASFGFGITATIEANNETEAINKLKEIITPMVGENSVSLSVFESDCDCKSIDLRNVEFNECHYISEEK